ncbi:MAG: DNA-processing protein DprA [Candidatus Pacebacteria bacterium]|jgi:DNA processing protein|nr:DNA-protecting protein DprA [bacterium]MDP6527845.1 DNA-processing protein DprA [Candidatus Paceibacterota bacterium]MDP6659800.1 DNA-processing protein DprA [Candidatus Paceibacterota bacterium]|tara:strand:- start:7987 stop:8859 length:873 start_codon:yes stop_codon:yes gene_type:complete
MYSNVEYPLKQLAKDEFPALLSEIPDAPERLYIKGKLPRPETKLLCVVGSRRYTPYGKDVCKKLITNLRGSPVAIVSGLALGMDSIAHHSAINAGLQTVAVPGSGLDKEVLYPRMNQKLAEDILESRGALLSEFEPKFKATPYSFPQRNRIMAGMSHATLVVEAGERSGTLITARLATEYNRDVMTVPGSILSRSTYGPHILIKTGAIPVTTSEDILEALGIPKESVTNTSNLQNITDDERKVLQLLSSPMKRDSLIETLGMDITEANILLSVMELKGLIIERLGEIQSA